MEENGRYNRPQNMSMFISIKSCLVGSQIGNPNMRAVGTRSVSLFNKMDKNIIYNFTTNDLVYFV